MLELQAPQGPYTNVLDLQVFPAMSKRHSELLQVHSNTEADKERIWKIALAIWNTMTSSMVVRAFLLAYRIMGKIVETKGDTDWLKTEHPIAMSDEISQTQTEGLRRFRTLLGWMMMGLSLLNASKLAFLFL
jgi:hypothetical protein